MGGQTAKLLDNKNKRASFAHESKAYHADGMKQIRSASPDGLGDIEDYCNCLVATETIFVTTGCAMIKDIEIIKSRPSKQTKQPTN